MSPFVALTYKKDLDVFEKQCCEDECSGVLIRNVCRSRRHV